MNTGTARMVAILLSIAGSPATAGPARADIDEASWIWSTSAGADLGSFAAGVVYFRADFDLPRGIEIASAEVIVTADNLFALSVNGRGVGESEVTGDAWRTARRFSITELLGSGRNVFAVQAVNTLPGPAALLLSAEVRLADGQVVTLSSGEAWRYAETEQPNWEQLAFEDGAWSAVRVVGELGSPPWGRIAVPLALEPVRDLEGGVQRKAGEVRQQAIRQGAPVVVQAAAPGFAWPEGIVFLGDDCSLYRPRGAAGSSADSLNVTIFNPRNSRAFPEHDLPAPMKVGRKLLALEPARPGVEPRLLLDAGRGGIGSPSVTFDGESILLSMARDGDPFFHLYRVPAAGGEPRQLTEGPFHDIDPAELPDGRIVFTSTRIGTFEEYHSPPSRSLFVMDADGAGVRPLTHTPVFDNEPEVLADGRILFIRSDNFFDRGKVETLLHAIRPDGTAGQTEFGLDLGPEYGGRLRAFDCGSPAPLADGRVAFVSRPGVTLGRPGARESDLRHFRIGVGDVAALPDGRLLCTLARSVSVEVTVGGEQRTIRDTRYQEIGVLDPEGEPATFTRIHEASEGALHSPVHLGARPRPPVLADNVDRRSDDDVNATGYLFCANARFTRNTTAGWSHVRAVRFLAAKALTVRSSHSYIVHAGTEVTELGTIPLAPDGSFHVEVPANTPLAMQMVDAEGRSELNEMSWVFVRPGEQRSCVGCHQPRQAVAESSGRQALAMNARPLKLLGQGTPHRFRGNNAAVTGLMELQFDRYREVAGLNRHPRADDSRISGRQELAGLLAELCDGDPAQRISAAQRLAIFRDPAAAPGLCEQLRNRCREVSVAAAVALASCGTRLSIPPLLDALAGGDPLLAQAAAMAIENLTGFAEELDAFGPEARKNRQVERWRQWFERTSWNEIEAELVQRLDSSDRDVVRRAAVALGHTGAGAAREALRRYVLENRDDNPLPAWRQGGHRGDNARFNALSPVNPRTLQAATRSLGYLRDVRSIPMLVETIGRHSDPETANLFLAEAAVEALGRMESPVADAALVEAFAALQPYPRYTRWYGDHDALMACHASPVHYFITEALDARECRQATSIVPQLIASLPIDPDRALFLETDDVEEIVGRVIRRNGAEAAVVETCLALLGDPQASPVKEIQDAISTIHRCWAGAPTPENRAAQVLSLVCRDGAFEPRVREAFRRFSAMREEIPRVFDTGIPVVDELPRKHWVCFYLARTLGLLGQARSADVLIETLSSEPSEAAAGRPDPLGVGVLFLHDDLTPCWRAAVAWALGRLGERRAVPVLLAIVADLDNATDTRHAAAEALGEIGDPKSGAAIRALAADYPEVSTRRALLRACERLERRGE